MVNKFGWKSRSKKVTVVSMISDKVQFEILGKPDYTPILRGRNKMVCFATEDIKLQRGQSGVVRLPVALEMDGGTVK